MPEVTLAFRRARAEDVPDIVRMLADDPLGATRERYENPLPDSYARAFRAIDGDPNNELVVARWGERVVGVLQLTYLPSLTYQGGWRALIEGGTGGERRAARPGARRFYEAWDSSRLTKG